MLKLPHLITIFAVLQIQPLSNKLVIIPTYNEKENIEKMIRRVLALPIGFDLLIVDDSSPDGTGDIIKNIIPEFENRLHILERKTKDGLGRAYIAGFKWGLERKYDFFFEIDADFSHNPDDLIRLSAACDEGGFDLAVGSRYVKGVNVVNWPMSRVLMSYFASKYVRFVTGMSISDTTAGFVCYRRKLLEGIDLDKIKFKGYAFQIEMKFRSWKRKFKITEVPIIFTDRTEGQSKMSKGIFWEAIVGVMQMKLASWFGRY
jgi:dolichol-phosphate mannosyltransferase